MGSWGALILIVFHAAQEWTTQRQLKWIHMKCFTFNHWVIYNVFIRRGYLETLKNASAKHLVRVLHFHKGI